MLKKLVIGALATGIMLSGGVSVSANTETYSSNFTPKLNYAEKSYTIESFKYLTLDGKDVTSLSSLNDEDVKMTVVLPQQNENGEWLAYGFTSREAWEKSNMSTQKDTQQNKQSLPIEVGPTASGPCCTDFYENSNKGGEYIYWRDGFKNLPASWNNRISSISTASPSSSKTTIVWEDTNKRGDALIFDHAAFYGHTYNFTGKWNNNISSIEIVK
jgi:hypothetical protein